MNITDAMHARRSMRAFLDTPVEKEKLTAILCTAARTPSWANTQPWEVFIATGGTLERIRAAYAQKYAQKALPETEIPRPAQWPEDAKKRQRELGPDMARDCGEAASQFGVLNRALFHAPAVLYLCVDKMLSAWSLYDIGAYAQSMMLAAAEQGLGTIPAISLVLFPDVLRSELQIPDNLKLTIGIAMGYADPEHGINRLVSGRKSLEETAYFFD